MKNIFFIILSIFVSSQEVKIVDSIDTKPISYSKIIGYDNLYVTDSLGRYNFEVFPKGEVIISSAGYETKKISKMSKLIKLKPKFIQVETINLSEQNFNNENELGFLRSKNLIIIDQKREFAIEIINNDNNLCKVEKIIIPFKKSINDKGYLLIDFYENENGKVGFKLNTDEYFIPVKILQRNNILQVKDKIFIEKGKSIYVSTTWVENIFTKSEIYSNKIYFNTKKNKQQGKMFVRKTNNYNWALKAYTENIETKNSIIPAFKIIAKCTD